MKTIALTGDGLTLADLRAVAEKRVGVTLAASARKAMTASRRVVDRAVTRNERVYGLTTGFGKFADVAVSPDEIETLQKNLIRSHSAGVGQPLDDAVVRVMIALRVNALAKGCSGIRPSTVEALLAMLEADVL